MPAIGKRIHDSKAPTVNCEMSEKCHIGSMTNLERECIAITALHAAFSDGNKTDAERESIRTLCEELEVPNASALVTRVLLKKAPLAETTAKLNSPESRTLAYEMALGIIEADGHRNSGHGSSEQVLSSIPQSLLAE